MATYNTDEAFCSIFMMLLAKNYNNTLIFVKDTYKILLASIGFYMPDTVPALFSQYQELFSVSLSMYSSISYFTKCRTGIFRP